MGVSGLMFNKKVLSKKVLRAILVVSLVFLFSTTLVAQEVNLKLLHTNDMHARIEAGKYDGMGMARISTKVKEFREKHSNVLVLDAGDNVHGKPIAMINKGESVVDVMNIIGYDAMTIGNHEFDYGPERLRELMDMFDFPVISANLKESDGSLFAGDKGYIIKEYNGVKVGVFGLSTPETAYKSHPKNVEGLKFENPVTTSKKMVNELDDKVDIIIALAHLGMDARSKAANRSDNLAKKVEGIDLIVDGHSHSKLPTGKRVGDTLIVQAHEYDKSLGIVDLTVENGKVKSATARYLTKKEASDVKKDPQVMTAIKDIKAQNEKITSKVVGQTEIRLNGERGSVRTGETNLGNLITDSFLAHTGADLAMTNGGGIRASIKPGEITLGEVITVLPFGNIVAVKELSGADIKAAIEHGIDAYPDNNGAFPHVAGINYRFNPARKSGNKVVDIEINGRDLKMDTKYKVATNDFMAAGGDEYTMFAQAPEVASLGGMDQMLVKHIKKLGTVNSQNAKVEGRIQAVSDSYVVKAGDILSEIANKLDVSVAKLVKFNQIKDQNMILPGQEIFTPAD
jgi:5'-nucleotidase